MNPAFRSNISKSGVHHINKTFCRLSHTNVKIVHSFSNLFAIHKLIVKDFKYS